MKSALKAMRNKEMSSYKVSRVFNLPQQQRIDMLKTGRKAQVKQ
jgi:hypothetical protein